MRQLVVGLLAAALVLSALAQQSQGSWTQYGGEEGANLNYHKATTDGIGSSNAPDLKVLWKVRTNANESATPAVYKGVVYFPDWNGFLWAVKARSGEVVWKKKVADLVPKAPRAAVLISRNTPAIDTQRGIMVLGTRSQTGVVAGNYAWMFAVTLDGKPVWQADLSYHPYGMITMSPTLYQDSIFVGMASLEELIAGINKTYECCTFRGSMYRLNVADGKVIWQTYVVPANGGKAGGFSGVSVWGSAPAVDASRNRVYVATGNNYAAPKWVEDCLKQAPDIPTKAHCASVPGNWFNSILAFDIGNGKIEWGQRVDAFDIWTVACLFGTNPAACRAPESPDFDFGQAPMYFPGTSCRVNGQRVTRDILVVGQKSGFVYGFDASDSPYRACTSPKRLLWSTTTGAGSTLGGSEFGSTTDGVRTVFLQNTNSGSINVTLTKPAPGSSKNTFGGFWSAVDICTGAIKWQSASPLGGLSLPAGGPTYSTSGKRRDGVIFAPTLAADGTVHALRATDGKIVSSFKVGASTLCAPSIVDNVLYIGSGYNMGFTAGKYTWAFALPSVTTGGSHSSPKSSPVRGPGHNTSPKPSSAHEPGRHHGGRD